MPISFHCECCKKKIKAPDEAGGKWGSCPHCKHRCYIPLPPSDDEPELKLAPIDEEEESRYHELMRETHSLTQDILHETKTSDQGDDLDGDAGGMEEKDLVKGIILYLRQMAEGQLDEADQTAAKIVRFAPQAKGILKKMARAERPEPELADIAPKVLQGFMKGLYGRL